jgi:predicted aspartyl protease
MGMFEVNVKLANLATPGQTEELSLLVDTGATLSWIPRAILKKLGVTAFSRLPFTLADGEDGEAAVLGATSLEGLGFMVEPVGEKLVPRDLRQLRACRD